MKKRSIANGQTMTDIAVLIIALSLLSLFDIGFSITGFGTGGGPVYVMDTNLSSCTTINAAGNYYINQSINSTATCIYITASNVLLDCQGYTIEYGTGGSSWESGVNISGSSLTNVTVRNCNIWNNDTVSGFTAGIRSIGATSSLYNNTIYNANGTDWNWGIFLRNSTGSAVTGNRINLTSVNGTVGIEVYGVSTANTITGNNITLSGVGSAGIMVRFNYSTGNNFDYNNIIAMQANSWAIYSDGAYGNTFTGNRVDGNWTDWYSFTPADLGDNTITNMTQTRSGVTVSFVDHNGTFLRSVTANEAYADPPGQINTSRWFSANGQDANSWLYANVYYNESDVFAKGINESSLRIWRYNGTNWTNSSFYDSGYYGVDTVGNFVYANITNFSMFGVFGAPPIIPPPINSESSDPGEWRMFGRFLNHTRYNPVNTTANLNANVSSVAVGPIFDSSPAVANGIVYIGSDNYNVYALNASNISQILGNFSTGSYVRSSPAVANGVVYVGSLDNKTYALNASNISQKLGEFNTGSYIYSSPAVYNGVVYLGNSNGILYALNASNISQQIGNFTLGGGAPGTYTNSPAVSNGVVYVGSLNDLYLYALNASNVSQQLANFSVGYTHSSAAIANGIVYIGSNDNKTYALNASNISQQLGSFTTGGNVWSSPAVANGVVYIGSDDNKVYALNASNISQQLGSFTTGVDVRSSPAVANGVVYVGSQDWNFYALNASNINQKLDNFSTGSNIDFTSPAIANGVVYAASSSGYLYAFGPPSLLPDGSACTVSAQCLGGFCVHGTCRSSATYCGDTFCDSGEICSSCSADCGACQGGGGGPVYNPPTLPPAPPGPPAEQVVMTTELGFGNALITFAPADVLLTLDFSKADMSVMSLTFTPECDIVNGSVNITRLPASVYAPRLGEFPYDAFDVEYSGFECNTSDITIRLKVNKTWIDENNVSAKAVLLMVKEGGVWHALNTSYVYEDDKYYYYKAISSHFSMFAIVASSPQLWCASICPEEPWSECVDGIMTRVTPKCVEDKCIIVSESDVCETPGGGAPPIQMPPELIIIPVIGLAVGSYLVASRRRRKPPEFGPSI